MYTMDVIDLHIYYEFVRRWQHSPLFQQNHIATVFCQSEVTCLEEGTSFYNLYKVQYELMTALPSPLSLETSTLVCIAIYIIIPEVIMWLRAIRKVQFV